MFWKVIGAIIVLWLVFTVIGVVIKGLFWLAIIGGVLFAGTAAYGAIKGAKGQRSLR